MVTLWSSLVRVGSVFAFTGWEELYLLGKYDEKYGINCKNTTIIHPTKGWKNVFKTCVWIPVCFNLSQSVEQYALNTFFHPFVGCIMVVLLQLIPYFHHTYLGGTVPPILCWESLQSQ